MRACVYTARVAFVIKRRLLSLPSLVRLDVSCQNCESENGGVVDVVERKGSPLHRPRGHLDTFHDTFLRSRASPRAFIASRRRVRARRYKRAADTMKERRGTVFRRPFSSLVPSTAEAK